MTPRDWQQIKELVADALEREGADRDAFLQKVSEGGDTVGREVQRLVAEHEQAAGFLAQRISLESKLSGISEPEDPALTQQRIGPYRILRELGHGGMGAVYLAERADGQFHKQVAIKLVHPQLSTEEILRRFRNERQILAVLNHPNIARLLDGGTTEDGRPYLVMEYVEGVPIHHWCQSRKLNVRDRLRLFRKVCDAVQYAHDMQVLHRDIKPGNISVVTDGTPQLLDFGIAKVLSRELSAETLETAVGLGPMTPEYASPEQIRGDPIGPASDIYSLGVVLYQLLSGQLPYAIRGSDYGQLRRLICEQEPLKPSLPGDLDKVVLKALRKEPERRYASVAQLSEDIERFLQDMPVRAHRENLVYRAAKFLKRNRTAAVAAVLGAAVVLALIAGLGRFGVSPRGGNPTRVVPDPRWGHLRFEKIAGIGDRAPGGGFYASDFEPYGLNSSSDLAFAADLSTGGEGAFLLAAGSARVAVALARHGEAAPGGGVFEGSTLGHTAINNAGDLAFVFGLKPFSAPALKGFSKAGLFRYSRRDGTVSALVVPGVTVAPGFGTFESAGQHASMNTAGDIVFPGVVRTLQGVAPASGVGQGIFMADRAGRITKVAAPGDPAPGRGVYDFAANPWINDRGDIAFGAHVAGEECIPITPGCMESIYLRSAASGRIESIAHQGGQAVNGNFLRGAWGPAINNSGDLVFMGELMPPPGLPSARGIYLYSNGVTALIARPGDIMPDGRKILTVNPVSSAGNYSLNQRSEVSFNAALEDGDSGLYVYSRGALHLVAGTGTAIPGVGTVASVSGLIGGVLNDAGQVFFWATPKDGRGVLLLATPSPEAGK